MNQDDLDFRVALHQRWLAHDGGQRLEMSDVRLERLRLVKANLESSYFYRCNMASVNFRGVNLQNSTIKNCSFSNSSLIEANLSSCNLYGTTFEDCDMDHACLDGAFLTFGKIITCNTQRMRIKGVQMRGLVAGNNYPSVFATFQIGAHLAVFGGGYGQIGCEYHTYDYWLKHGRAIGRKHSYNEDEMKLYSKMVRLAIAHLKTVEPDDYFEMEGVW